MENRRKGTGDTADPVETDFQGEALFLAEQYGMLLRERERLKTMLEGSWEYTMDEAAAELESLSVSYDRERVQSSSISNPVERIVMKITDPVFMARKQREKNRQRIWCEEEYRYTVWKIGIVEAAMRERMKKGDRGIFRKIFVENWTYREMQSRHKRPLSHSQIERAEVRALNALEAQLRIVHSFEAGEPFERRLTGEAGEYWQEVRNGKNEKDPAGG